MAKSNIASTIATELFNRRDKLFHDLVDELSNRGYIYLGFDRTVFFKPSEGDFKDCKNGAEYVKACHIPKLDLNEFVEIIYDSKRLFAERLISKAEFDEFKKTGYVKLRNAWLEARKKKAAEKRAANATDIDELRAKIKKLQKKIASLEGEEVA